jgi:hypothetical protein
MEALCFDVAAEQLAEPSVEIEKHEAAELSAVEAAVAVDLSSAAAAEGVAVSAAV